MVRVRLFQDWINKRTLGKFRRGGIGCETRYGTEDPLRSKIIVERLRHLLKELVGPKHASFILGRQTSDNIIIVQELLHTIRRMHGRKEAMIIKVDLEKAYDRIRWEFRQQTLEMAGFPPNLIKLVMNCVQVDATSILWNGENQKCLLHLED